jgi:periplasmic protein TonB
MAYVGLADRADRTKALIGVASVHLALAAALLSGLSVTMARQAIDHLATFDVRDVPPPPPVKPPLPKPRPHQAKKAEGAPAPKTEPSPLVAPPPKLPVPSPVPAAKVAGTGSASTSGAALAGNGTGAGGAGNGAGGGGDYSGFTPAQQITTIPNREYRRLAASGIVNGSVGITLRVNSDGSATNCRIARSSGNAIDDATMCQLATYYIRFRPALDAYGRPVAQDITWFPRWWRP